MKPLRKCYVLREIEVDMLEIEKGDLFRLDKATPDDTVDPSQIYLAEESASKTDTGGVNLSASPIGFVKTHDHTIFVRLGKMPKSLEQAYGAIKVLGSKQTNEGDK